MKRPLLCLFVLAILGPLALIAGEKANTIRLHPGDTVYARFQEKGKKLKLLSATKEKDANAQLVISLSAKDKDGTTTLKIENAFSDDLVYKGTMRSHVLDRHAPLADCPIVGGKMGTVSLPPLVDEVTLFDFQFEPATLLEKDSDH